MSRITLDIPDALRRSLDEIGRQQRRSFDDLVRDLVRDMLERYVAAERFRELRQRMLDRLGDDAPPTDDDAFKRAS